MCLEKLLQQKAEKTPSPLFQFNPNIIPSCWAGVSNPLFTFDNNYHKQITVAIVFKTDSWMVANIYEKTKKAWEEYVELKQVEMGSFQKWIRKNQLIKCKNIATLYTEKVKINTKIGKKPKRLKHIYKNKDESNEQLINKLVQNESGEANDENTLRNEDSFNSEDLNYSNDKTKTNDNSTDTSQMDIDTSNNYKRQNSKEESKDLDLELGIIKKPR
ncbi:hypothetical protein M0802_000507 [Mischocyttarus mexicanus]|nr:hypothetical protein M0802_000507 [Mischocyttarus mexicanus]